MELTMDWTIKVTDLAIIFATLFGPIFAVKAQKAVERNRAKKDAQEKCFFILMATRALHMSPGHVEALNSIPILFYDRGVSRESQEGKALEAINRHWDALLHHFNQDQTGFSPEQGRTWEKERKAFEVALLKSMGDYLGFNFAELDIDNKHYFPVGHHDMLMDNEVIRRGMATILSGKAGFPIYVTGVANPAPAQANPTPANDVPAQPAEVIPPQAGDRPAA